MTRYGSAYFGSPISIYGLDNTVISEQEKNGSQRRARAYKRNSRNDVDANGAPISPLNGLVLFYNMETLTGSQIKDLSGNGYHGTLFGTGYTLGSTGKRGKAVTFNGQTAPNHLVSGGRIETGGTVLQLQEMTVCAWINAGDMSINNTIFATNTFAVNTGIEVKWDTTNRQAGFEYGHTSGFQTNTFGTGGEHVDFPIGSWTHLVFSYKAGVIKFYQDGSLYGTKTNTNTPILYTRGSFAVGALVAGQNWANGLIDEVRVYNRELTAQEVSDIKNDTSLY